MSTAPYPWKIEGEYLESCNCKVLCPCLLSHGSERPTDGHCDVVMAFHIKRGTYGTTDLSNLNAVIALYAPGAMSQGNWTLATYIDERGVKAQRDALEAIFTGAAGGPPSQMAAMVTKRFPTKAVPIAFDLDGSTRRLRIANISDVTVEGIAGADGNPIWIENVFHPASRRLAAARTSDGRFNDDSLRFENSGRNGHFAPISWSSGP